MRALNLDGRRLKIHAHDLLAQVMEHETSYPGRCTGHRPGDQEERMTATNANRIMKDNGRDDR